MQPLTTWLPCILIGLAAGLAAAGEAAPAKAPAKPSRSELMDYGPFLTATFGLGKGVAANKGVAVRLGGEPQAALCFDIDALRVAAAWTGPFIDHLGLPFKGGWNNARGPNIVGDVHWSTRPGPGWARGGDFSDPRPHGDGQLPADWARYRGLHRHGDRVVFAYSVGDCAVLELPGALSAGGATVFTRSLRLGPSRQPLLMLVCDAEGAAASLVDGGALLVADGAEIHAAASGLPAGATWIAKDGRVVLALPASTEAVTLRVAMARGATARAALAAPLAAPAEDLEAMTRGGPSRWTETVTTAGALGADQGGYAVDTIAPPDDNPWKSWMRFGGLDFFADGRAALCTWSGDVWIASGLDDSLAKVTWRRFASGLFQPLGLKIVDDTIHVLCHGPIVRLHDVDGDGEADHYQSFNNDCNVTNSYHEFACDLQTDSAGNFWFTKGSPALVGRKLFERYTPHHGTLLKVSKDGARMEVVASGFREPNGLAIGPGDLITVTDNQGNWQPGSPINLITPGGFYGMPDPASTAPMPQRDPPLAWLPLATDNSSGSQVWVTGGKWGPLEGGLLLMSYGKCALFSVLLDRPSAGARPVQAAVVRFPLAFASGIMRGRFSPRDGQLYVCGLKSWGTAAGKDGCFQRVRHTGKPVHLPTGFHVTRKGIELGFPNPLDPATAGDAGNYAAEWFNVVASQEYGSPEFSVADPKKQGRDPLPIAGATLSADRRTVALEIPGLKPVTNVVIKLKITAADGTALSHEIAGTINRLGD